MGFLQPDELTLFNLVVEVIDAGEAEVLYVKKRFRRTGVVSMRVLASVLRSLFRL
jgi:hypothetical protein